jgi:hypothetical protein
MSRLVGDIAIQIITDTDRRKSEPLGPNGQIVVGDRNLSSEEDPANGNSINHQE